MVLSSTRSMLAGALLSFATLHATANVIAFETAPTAIFPPGDSYVESGFTVTMGAGYGVIDTAATCALTQCPAGNDTSFLSAVNDGTVSIRSTDNYAFAITGFDAGFFAPLFLGLPDISSGQIMVTGIKKATGATVFAAFDLGTTDAAGFFNFNTYALRSSFTGLKSVTLSACVYTDFGCESGVDEVLNQSQFAVDNINVTVVPEPATIALFGLGLLGLAFVRRTNLRKSRD